MGVEIDLLTPLRRYWGYSTFRPLQERVVRSLLAGRDTCVVMPTGGGKSLCYQLPALVSERTAVVISPLIALMQDQAAQLAQMGIPAAVLNSTLSDGEQGAMRKGRFHREPGHRRDQTWHDMWWRATVCCRKINGEWMITHERSPVPFDVESDKASLDLML